MRFQAQIQQFGVLWVVVVFLEFHARILDVPHFNRKTQLSALLEHQLGQFRDAVGFGELVEHAILSSARGIHDGQLHAAQRISDIQEAAVLSAFSVHR